MNSEGRPQVEQGGGEEERKDSQNAHVVVTVEDSKSDKDVEKELATKAMFGSNRNQPPVYYANAPLQGGQPPPSQPYGFQPYGTQPYGQRPTYQTYPMYQSTRYQDDYRQQPPSRYGDSSAAIDNEFLFDDEEIRRVFVRNVYTLLSILLLFTISVTAAFIFILPLKYFIMRNFYIYIVSTVVTLVIMIAIVCCENARRSFPCNYILLFILVVAQTLMVSTVSAYYDTYVVLMAFGITAAITVLITIIAAFAPIDVTGCGFILCMMGMALMISGVVISILALTIGVSRIVFTVYASIGAVLMTLYLLYDTQLILGGRKHQLSPEEHVLAVLLLYIDIITLFLMLLQAIGGR